jgi:glycosyltransferase involved in cell wall biosynthesis
VRVLIAYPYFQGREEPGHALVFDLARHLAGQGHEVHVIAGEVGYMRARASRARSWRLVRTETMEGIRVHRTYTFASLHGGYGARALGFATQAASSVAALLSMPRPDAVFASSPPLPAASVASWYCRLRRVPLVLEVRDLWPESIAQLGIVRNRLLLALLRGMERRLYNRAAAIVALTAGIARDIRERGWRTIAVEFVPCGVELAEFRPDEAARLRMRERLGWEGKVVALYFGAIGDANNIPVILAAARRLLGRKDIAIVLVGDGMRRIEVARRIEAEGLHNVRLLPAVARSQAPEYLRAADVCLATLRDLPLFEGAIPTKLVEAMACARPVLCGVRGEARAIVEEAGAGLAFAPDDDDGLAKALGRLAGDDALRAQMGARGAAFARERFSAAHSRARIAALLAQAAAGR